MFDWVPQSFSSEIASPLFWAYFVDATTCEHALKPRLLLVPRIFSNPVHVLGNPRVNARIWRLTAFVAETNNAQLYPVRVELQH